LRALLFRYYKSNRDVVYDMELQGLVNQLSAKGTIKTGDGKVTKFVFHFVSTFSYHIKYRSIWANGYPIIIFKAITRLDMKNNGKF